MVSSSSPSGTAGTGPTFKNLYDYPHPIAEGGVADETYLRNSILYPARQVVPGWGNVMPVMSFKEGEVGALIEYIKRQSDAYTADEGLPETAGEGGAESEAETPAAPPANPL